MLIFRFSAEFRIFSFTFRFFKNDFLLFLKNQKKFFIFFWFTDTTTKYCSKSFGKQSVTSWFAGMRFFRFRSMFESAVSPLGTRVGVQRELPRRGGGEGDGLVAGWRMGSKWSQEFCPSNSSICTPSLSTLITLHTHTHIHTHSFSLSLTHTHTHRHSGLPAATISPYHAKVSPCMLYLC